MKQLDLTQNRLKITYLAMLFIIAFILPLQAQVTIGSGLSPNENALLDLKEETITTKGLLLPRVKLEGTNMPHPLLAHVEGMLVFNRLPAGSGSTAVTQGIYYNTGTNWERVNSSFTNWFYMPSVVFDTSSTGNNLIKPLYDLYASQFGSPKFASEDAPSSVSLIPSASDLYYYITDYDEDVFEIVSLSKEGVLTYNIKNTASAYTLINIVFVLK